MSLNEAKGRQPLFSLEVLMAEGMSQKDARALLREMDKMRKKERRARAKSRQEITGIEIDEVLGARLCNA